MKLRCPSLVRCAATVASVGLVLSAAACSSVPEVPGTLQHYWSEGGTSLVVVVEHGRCEEVKDPRATETETTGAVTVPLDPMGPDETCTMDLIASPVEITLDAPLGERRVVVGEGESAGQAVPQASAPITVP